MGTFYATCALQNPAERERSTVVAKLIVDTGSEATWVPAVALERVGIQREPKSITFVMANGRRVTRDVGFAIVRLDRYFTTDEIVFAEPGDLALLGAHTLEGLNLTVDARRRRLLTAPSFPPAALGTAT